MGYTISMDIFTASGHKSVMILSGETVDELIEKFPKAIKDGVEVADLFGSIDPAVMKKWTEDKEAESEERRRIEKSN